MELLIASLYENIESGIRFFNEKGGWTQVEQLKVRMDSKFRVFSNGSSAQKRHVQMMHTRQGRGVRGRRLAMHAPVASFWGRGCTAAKDDARPIRCMGSKETLTLHTRASTQAAQDIYITIFRC